MKKLFATVTLIVLSALGASAQNQFPSGTGAASSFVKKASQPATCSVGQVYFDLGASTGYLCTTANTWTAWGSGGGGSGTVTSFSAGNLSPLFTTSVATPTTTPALTFALSNAAQNSVFAGPASGGAGAPSFQTAPTISAANMTNFPTFNQNTTGSAASLSSTLACGVFPALTGDVTTSAGSCATSVVKVNGAAVPASATILGSNSSSQAIAAALASADIYVGNGSNLPVAVAVTGDATLSNAGLLTVTQIEAAAIPASAAVVGTNFSKQLIASTPHQVGLPLQCADTSSSATTYTCTTTPSIASLATGDTFIFTSINQNNSGSSTLNIDAIGAKTLKKYQNTANLAAGDLQASSTVLVTYDGTNFEISQIGNAPSGSGTINAASQYAWPYYSASGSATTISGLAPATTNGIWYAIQNVVSNAAVAQTLALAGVLPNPQTGTSYTYLYSDRVGYTTFSNASAIAVTLPAAGGTGFTQNWANVSCDIGAGTATITPTTSTISYTTGTAYTSAASSLALTTGQCAWIYSDNTNYFAIVRSGGAGVTSIATTSPITGGTITTTGTIACATCATTTNGGAISFDKSATGLINPTADATFTEPIGSTTGLTLAGTAPASVSTSTGTNATSLFNVNGVTGGADSNATGTAGIGSSPTWAAGNGGAGTGTNTVGGAGGAMNFTAGNGGASNGTGVNSNGGSFVFTPGTAGTGGSGTAGKAGVFSIAGTGAGFYYFSQGTAITTANSVIPANSIIEAAPTAVTAYTLTKPGAAPTNNFSGKYTTTAGVESYAKLPQTVMLTTQYTNSTTGFTNVTGTNSLAFQMDASTTYQGKCVLFYQAASTGGLNIEFTGPASPTFVTYGLLDPGSNTALVSASVATAYSTSLGAAVSTATTNFPATVYFGISNGTTAGTLQLLAKSSAAVQLQIQTGSYCIMQ